MGAYGRSTPRSLPPLAATKKGKVHPAAFNRMQNYTAVAGVQELLRDALQTVLVEQPERPAEFLSAYFAEQQVVLDEKAVAREAKMAEKAARSARFTTSPSPGPGVTEADAVELEALKASIAAGHMLTAAQMDRLAQLASMPPAIWEEAVGGGGEKKKTPLQEMVEFEEHMAAGHMIHLNEMARVEAIIEEQKKTITEKMAAGHMLSADELEIMTRLGG